MRDSGKFRKKPVVVNAIRFTSGNYFKCLDFIGKDNLSRFGVDPPVLGIKTLEGTMTANEGDWIIRGVKGEFYPCKNDIFEETYEEA